jgi:hypothetical protein
MGTFHSDIREKERGQRKQKRNIQEKLDISDNNIKYSVSSWHPEIP